MPNDQLKAEVTIVFKKDLPGDLPTKMEGHFRRPSAPAATCAIGTALEGFTVLSRVAFAEDRLATAYFYIEEDVRALKVHIEKRNSARFDTYENELKEVKDIIESEMKSLARLAKSVSNQIVDVKVLVSCGDIRMTSATRKGYRTRLKEGVKANLVAKLAAPVATALVGVVFAQDAAAFFRLFGTGLATVVVASLLEALSAESFSYERS